jgi:hypothetical protein
MSKPIETALSGGQKRVSRRRGRRHARDVTPLLVVLDELNHEWRAAAAYVAAMEREERAATRYRMAWEARCSAVN